MPWMAQLSGAWGDGGGIRMKISYYVIWLIGWMVTWPAMFAHFEQHHDCDTLWKTDLGTAMVVSALPPAWLLTPFLTGFYEDGFELAIIPPHRCGER
jgi:hypothetical protein